MAGDRAMLFTCRDRFWHEMPLWAPGGTPEVVWEMPQRAPPSQHCASFQVPVHCTWVSSQRSGEAGMVHISKWDPSEDADTLPISYGNESVDKRLNFSDALLSPWWNEHSNRSHLQRQLGTLKNAQEKETGHARPLLSSEDPSLLPEDPNNGCHQLKGCCSTKVLPMFRGCISFPSKSREPHFTGGKAS